MGVDDLKNEAIAMSRWEKHRFLLLIASVITIAVFLVSIAMNLYNSSGAAQLDLSRPGYQDVRNKAARDTTTTSFPSSGALNKDAMNSFKKLYSDNTGKVTSVDSFDAAALSEDSLQVWEPNTRPIQPQLSSI